MILYMTRIVVIMTRINVIKMTRVNNKGNDPKEMTGGNRWKDNFSNRDNFSKM